MRGLWLILAVAIFAVTTLLPTGVPLASGQTKKAPPKKEPAPKKDGDVPPGEKVGLPSKPILAVDSPGHLAPITDLAFSSDGRRLYTVSEDNTIQAWDAASGERVRTYRLPWKQVVSSKLTGMVAGFTTLTPSPDGKTLLAVLNRSDHLTPRPHLALVNLETGEIRHIFRDLHNTQNGFAALAFSPDGEQLAVVAGRFGDFQSVCLLRGLGKVWESEAGRPALAKEWQVSTLFDVQFSPDGNRLLACGRVFGGPSKDYNNVFIQDLKNLEAKTQQLTQGPTHGPGFATLRASWGPGRLALEGDLVDAKTHRRPVVVWLPGGKPTVLRAFNYEPAMPIPGFDPKKLGYGASHLPRPFFRSENELLLLGTAAEDRTAPAVQRFDLSRNRLEEIVHFPRPEKLHRLKLSPDGKSLAILSGAGRNQVAVLDVEPGAKVRPFKVEVDPTPYVAFSKKGLRLAWTGPDRARLVAGLDLRTAEPLRPEELDPAGFETPATRASSLKFPAEKASLARDGLTAEPCFSRGGLFNLLHEGNRRIVLSIYAVGPEWVVCTPEGYYAASPGGEKRVGWHCNNGFNRLATFLPLERFHKRLYRPDVLAQLVERGSLGEAIKVANALRVPEPGQPPPAAGAAPAELDKQLPPRATLTLLDQSKLPTVTVQTQAEAASKDQPVTALRLLVDGRPLPDGAASERFGDEGKQQTSLKWTVTLPPGKHQLTVLARCPDSSAVSPALEVSVADPDRQNTLRVLAVGVSDYEDASLKLEAAARDAQQLAAGFEKACKGDLFQTVAAEVLTDKKARKEAILAAVATLRKQVKSNDLVVVFFAGHGVKEKDKFYLLNVEAKVDDLAGTALSGDDLRKALGEFPCQVLLLLDACHASAALKKYRPPVDDLTRQMTDDECGVAVLCAAMGHEKAMEKEGNGLFTRAVLDGLNRGEGVPFNRANRLLYVHHLHAFVFDRVSEESGGRQHPFLSLPWVVESFPVARFPDRKP